MSDLPRGVCDGKFGPAEFVIAGLDQAIHTVTPRPGESPWTTGSSPVVTGPHSASAPVRSSTLSPLAGGESTAHGAIDAAVAEIQAAFSRAGEINAFKLRVAHWIELGPQHPAVCARFAARAAALPQWRLDEAIGEIERWWHEERKTFVLASALGYGSRLPVETLRELRLILRLLRFKRMAAEFEAIAAAVREQEFALAAE